jgi:hypothetical protein
MSKTSRLEQLEQECHTRGVRLIYDDLRSEGGLCRLRGSFYLILNRRLASETKARIIADALARVPERMPQPEPAEQVSPAETAPVVVDYPEPVYEEPEFGVPVTAGVPDSQS